MRDVLAVIGATTIVSGIILGCLGLVLLARYLVRVNRRLDDRYPTERRPK